MGESPGAPTGRQDWQALFPESNRFRIAGRGRIYPTGFGEIPGRDGGRAHVAVPLVGDVGQIVGQTTFNGLAVNAPPVCALFALFDACLAQHLTH